MKNARGTVIFNTADAVVGLELAECIRVARHVSPDGIIIVNKCPIPAPGATYPPVETLVDALAFM